MSTHRDDEISRCVVVAVKKRRKSDASDNDKKSIDRFNEADAANKNIAAAAAAAASANL